MLTDRWPVVSLKRRDGLNPLSLQGLRQIADAAEVVLSDRPEGGSFHTPAAVERRTLEHASEAKSIWESAQST